MKQPESKPDKSLFVFEAYEEHEEENNTSIPYKADSFWKGSFKRLVKNKGAMVSLILLIIITILSILGPFMNVYHYIVQEDGRSHLPPLVPGLEWAGLDGTYSHHKNIYEQREMTDQPSWLGTDEFGRDLWTRLWKGTQISLLIGVVAAL